MKKKITITVLKNNKILVIIIAVTIHTNLVKEKYYNQKSEKIKVLKNRIKEKYKCKLQ
jgi:hypothetical protein